MLGLVMERKKWKWHVTFDEPSGNRSSRNISSNRHEQDNRPVRELGEKFGLLKVSFRGALIP